MPSKCGLINININIFYPQSLLNLRASVRRFFTVRLQQPSDGPQPQLKTQLTAINRQMVRYIFSLFFGKIKKFIYYYI